MRTLSPSRLLLTQIQTPMSHRLRGILAALCVTAAVCSAQSPVADDTKKIQPVTTTVVVEGRVADDYLPTTLNVGSFDGLPLLQSPVSATVVTRDLLTDQFSRVLSDVVKNDASIGEDYAPVGYYGDFQIRGFAVDLATGLQINGQVIAGEQDVPLENKERVEFLKGLAGVESGVASAGGLINYVTKRPALVKTVDIATDHRGSAFGTVDLGRLFGARKQGGVRVNLAGESMESYVDSAHGWRGVGASSADWKLTDKAALKTDFEYQHKRQRSEAVAEHHESSYCIDGIGDGVYVCDCLQPAWHLGDWEVGATCEHQRERYELEDCLRHLHPCGAKCQGGEERC